MSNNFDYLKDAMNKVSSKEEQGEKSSTFFQLPGEGCKMLSLQGMQRVLSIISYLSKSKAGMPVKASRALSDLFEAFNDLWAEDSGCAIQRVNMHSADIALCIQEIEDTELKFHAFFEAIHNIGRRT